MSYPGYDVVISNLYQGDDYDFTRYFRKVPAGQRIVRATLSIKTHPNDADADALYLVTITRTPDANGNVIANDGSQPPFVQGFGTAKLVWTLPAALTNTFVIGPDLYYGFQVLSSAGKKREPEHGVIRVKQQITTV